MYFMHPWVDIFLDIRCLTKKNYYYIIQGVKNYLGDVSAHALVSCHYQQLTLPAESHIKYIFSLVYRLASRAKECM